MLGTGLAAVLMGAVAVATAQASLPAAADRAAAPMVPAVAPAPAAARPHIAAPQFVFAQPLLGFAVNSPFGLRRMPWEEGGRLHEGVDIAAPAGTPVRVTLPGVVLRTGVDGGYGRFVDVSHGYGLTSRYAHLGRAARGLRPGMDLPGGAVVGYVGSSGRSTGSHLHFEIRLDGRPLNPVAFLGRTFASTAELPLRAAAAVPRRVRIAQVAGWPRGVRKADPVVRKPAAVATQVAVAPASPEGRVRATILPGASNANVLAIKPAAPVPAAGAPALQHELPAP
ncbi:MAG: M23 family metallopeptidase [Pseudomonadota bacterium]